MSVKKLELEAREGAGVAAVYEGVFARLELRAVIGAPALFTGCDVTLPYLTRVHGVFDHGGARAWGTDRFALCVANAPVLSQRGEAVEVSFSRSTAREAVRFLNAKGSGSAVVVRISEGVMMLSREGVDFSVSLRAEKHDEAPDLLGLVDRSALAAKEVEIPDAVRAVDSRFLAALRAAGALGTLKDREFTIAAYAERGSIWALSGSGRIGAMIMPRYRSEHPDVPASVLGLFKGEEVAA